MAVPLYMDVHVPQAITEQLRRRGLDVRTAAEYDAVTLKDDKVLEVFGHQLGGTIGQYVRDLDLIDKASEAAEWANKIEHLPY